MIIELYEKHGAKPLKDWTTYRMDRATLEMLAESRKSQAY